MNGTPRSRVSLGRAHKFHGRQRVRGNYSVTATVSERQRSTRSRQPQVDRLITRMTPNRRALRPHGRSSASGPASGAASDARAIKHESRSQRRASLRDRSCLTPARRGMSSDVEFMIVIALGRSRLR
jgi:hypothetical protein